MALGLAYVGFALDHSYHHRLILIDQPDMLAIQRRAGRAMLRGLQQEALGESETSASS